MNSDAVIAIAAPIVVVLLLVVAAGIRHRRARRDLEGHFIAEYGRSFGAEPTAPANGLAEGGRPEPRPGGGDRPEGPAPPSP